MSSRTNFFPIGELVSSSKILELDYDEQQYLLSRIRRTTSDIGMVPSLEPEQTDVSLRGIRIKPRVASSLGTKATMGIDYSETIRGLKSAAISVRHDHGSNSKEYHLAPAMDIWEEWHPGHDEAAQYLTHSQLITELSPLVPNERIFEPIIDRVDIKGMEIAYLLADFLKKSATTRTRNTHLGTDTLVAGDNYLSRTETSLSIKEINNRRIHSLAVGAIYDIELAHIKKRYSYIINSTEQAQSISSAVGAVTFSSADGVPRNRLEQFARIDQDRNDPLAVFHRGLKDLRGHYGVSEQ
ncbi:hypothetical protein H7X69_01485 [Candidatus Saccharibacteria bacterium]|nr:hypothetical protein [Candidatus Saccharibacteria bacterium]